MRIEQEILSLTISAVKNTLSYIGSTEVQIQIAMILGIFLLSLYLARLIVRQTAGMKPLPGFHIPWKLYLSNEQVIYALLLIVFSWAAVGINEQTVLPNKLLGTFATLATAWGIIRLSTSGMTSRNAATAITIIIWSITALSFLGWLSPLITFLGDTSITLGGTSISLLSIIKGIAFFVLALWGANALSRTIETRLNVWQVLNPSQKVLFSKLSRIFLLIVSIAIGLNIVGIDLTALAVFSGALGLGIGIGLQKIFSNLLSGFILLLDKSIKPGDVIGIGDTYGWVNRLGARCVSVITRDSKEYLIPNENLITEQVENWTYSENKLRIHIPLGVSYRSDLQLVKKLLLQATTEHPRILKNPAPNCLIMKFGESSVQHEIRAWIADPQNGMSNVRSDIYYRVWDLFKEHGVEIPFPQHDVHLHHVNAPSKTSQE